MTDHPVSLRVLVVEDEPLVGMIIEDVIEELGWQVVGPVAILAEATELASVARIDCAVLDVNVRGGHTYPLAAMLAERGIPVLMATGYGDAAMPEQLLRERRLTKPYTHDQLKIELRLLSQRAVLRGV